MSSVDGEGRRYVINSAEDKVSVDRVGILGSSNRGGASAHDAPDWDMCVLQADHRVRVRVRLPREKTARDYVIRHREPETPPRVMSATRGRVEKGRAAPTALILLSVTVTVTVTVPVLREQ